MKWWAWIRWLQARWRFHRLVQRLPEDDESVVFLLTNGRSYLAVGLERGSALDLPDGWELRRASPPIGSELRFDENENELRATPIPKEARE